MVDHPNLLMVDDGRFLNFRWTNGKIKKLSPAPSCWRDCGRQRLSPWRRWGILRWILHRSEMGEIAGRRARPLQRIAASDFRKGIQQFPPQIVERFIHHPRKVLLVHGENSLPNGYGKCTNHYNCLTWKEYKWWNCFAKSETRWTSLNMGVHQRNRY